MSDLDGVRWNVGFLGVLRLSFSLLRSFILVLLGGAVLDLWIRVILFYE